MEPKIRVLEYYTSPSGKQPVRLWLEKIKDKLTQAMIYKRIRQDGLGNFGNCKSVGRGVHELKIDYGPGFRVYYGIHKNELILLLSGGDKSTQQVDIEKAKLSWKNWLEEHSED